MTGASSEQNWADGIHAVLKKAGVELVAYVPDAGHKRLINLCADDPEMRMINLTTEEEGMGLLAGAWLGGKRGVVLMQSSGVGNCINALASLTLACRFPLLMLITMRGEWGEGNPWQIPMGQSVEPILKTMNIACVRANTHDEVAGAVSAMAAMAFNSCHATAVLLTQRLIGSKSFQD